MASAEEDIVKLNGQIATVQHRLDILEEKVGTLGGNVSSLETQFGKFDSNNNQSYNLILWGAVVAIVVVAYLLRRYIGFISVRDKLFK